MKRPSPIDEGMRQLNSSELEKSGRIFLAQQGMKWEDDIKKCGRCGVLYRGNICAMCVNGQERKKKLKIYKTRKY